MAKRREPQSGRTRRKRSRRKRYLVVSGGKVTEPQYFAWLTNELGISGSVVVVGPSGGTDPVSVVQRASQLAREDQKDSRDSGADAYTKVWAVTDVDDFTNLNKASRLAKDSDIELVISNPCFEVWLIDHLEQCPASCSETKRCERHAQALGLLKAPKSGKLKHINKDLLDHHLSDALAHAERHNTKEKRAIRSRNPEQVEKYRVWTDVSDIAHELQAESSRLGAS